MLYCAKFNEVRREVFDEVSDWMGHTDNIWLHVTIMYNGNNIKGGVTIEGEAGYSKEYYKVFKHFADVYCQNFVEVYC